MNRAAVPLTILLLMGLLAGCGKTESAKSVPAEEGVGGERRQAAALPKSETQSKPDNRQQQSAPSSKSATPAVQRPAKQQQAIDALLKMYATVLVDPTKPDRPVVKVILKKSSGNTIRGTDLEHLEALDTIEELDLQGTSITDITHVAGLKRLKVFYTPPLTPDQFEIVAGLPSLESLSCTIKKPEIKRSTDSSVPAKDRRKSYQQANDQDFVQQALATLSQSKGIRNLRLSPFTGVLHCTDDSFAPIPRFPNLRFFEVSGFIITDRHVASMSESRTLETLILHGNNATANISGAGIKKLSSCSVLKSLGMGAVNDDILAGVASIPSLTSFTYSQSLSGRKVSDSLLIRLKRDNPNLRLADRDSNRNRLWASLLPARQLVAVGGKGWNQPMEADPAEPPQDREELVEKIHKGMSRQAVISLLGQPDATMPIGQGQAMLYYLSDTEAFFITLDKSGNVFTADRQEPSK